MRHSKRNLGRISRFESLETRSLLAGNVTTNFNGTLLTITGDAAANNIQVSQLASGDWQVKGIGTNVNGPTTFTGVSEIDIDLAAGNDVLKVQNGTLTGPLKVLYTPGVQGSKTTQITNLHAETVDVEQASTGNNVVTLNNILFTSTMGGKVVTGSGHDVVSVNNIYSFGITVTTAGGNDAVTITNTFGQDDITVNAGDGSDTVVVNNCSSDGNIQLNLSDTTADGNDVVHFSGLNTFNLDVEDMHGNDTVVGSNSTIGNLANFNLTTGNDTLVLTGLHTGDAILGYVDDGSNVVSINNCISGSEIYVTGAGTPGNNVINISNCTSQDQISMDLYGGNDVVTLFNDTAALSSYIHAGDGNNVISVNKLTLLSGAEEDIDSGNGNDVMVITNSNFGGDFFIDAGDGRNAVSTVKDSIAFTFALTTGSGNDSFAMGNCNMKQGASVNTGAGTDAVSLVNIVVAENLILSLGPGNYDMLAVVNSSIAEPSFDGGNNPGDTLIISHSHFIAPFFTGFQHIVQA